MEEIKRSHSGVRGIIAEYGGPLTHEIAANYARAFAAMNGKGTYAVGGDTRVSTDAYIESVSEGLLGSGCDVVNLGYVPSPTICFNVAHDNRLNGGVILTASHNPGKYQGIKFVTRNGHLVLSGDCGQLFRMYDSKEFVSGSGFLLNLGYDPLDAHLGFIEQELGREAMNMIRSKGIRVAYDPTNGGMYQILPRLFETLNCDVYTMNGKPAFEQPGIGEDGFERNMEPVPENVTMLRYLTRQSADVGFAYDTDGDRVGVVDENGRYDTEENMLPLALWSVYEQRPEFISPVVTNLSSSRKNTYIAEKFKTKHVLSAVGEVAVYQKMLEEGSLAGGEGNGGFIYLGGIGNPVRDGLHATARILYLMAKTGRPSSELIDDLPALTIVKEKIGTVLPSDYVRQLKPHLQGAICDIDGLRIDYNNCEWLHIRPSNTEPVVRVIAEAPTEARARALTDHGIELLQHLKI